MFFLIVGLLDLGMCDIDLFLEGIIFLEGVMWRERFFRWMEERERRRKVRDVNLNWWCGIDGFGFSGVMLDEDEVEWKV